MSTIENTSSQPILFTDQAALRVEELVEEENNKELKLRVYVTGGGCSGFQYGFTFDDKISDDDTLIKNGNANLLVDSLSYQYIIGSEIDYEQGLQGSRFFVKNPNAKATCGCGASFSI